MQLYWIDITIN